MVNFSQLILILIALVWILIYLVLSIRKKEKNKNIEVLPLLLLIKTTKFNNFLIRVGNKHPKLYSVLGELSIVYGIGLMLYGIYFLSKNIFGIFFPERVGEASPVIPLIPGITFFPSLEEGLTFLLVLAIIVATHEMAHGFVASSSKINIKSSGAGLLYVFPLAFVELDDKSMEKVSSKERLRVFSAGSFVNLVEGIIFILLLFSFPYLISFGYSFESEGVLIIRVSENTPAYFAGLQKGDAIVAINNTPVKNYYEFNVYLEKTKPFSNVTLTIERNLKKFEVNVTLSKHPVYNRGVLGVSVIDYHRPYSEFFPAIFQYFIYLLIGWGVVLGISLAVINMLPFFITDGDKVLAEILKVLIKNNNLRNFSLNLIRTFTLFILIFNIMFTFTLR